MADHEEPGEGPEFGVRALGYSRREVDEFVAEVRRELRGLRPGPEYAPVAPGRMLPDPVPGRIHRLLRFAQDEADHRMEVARQQAEQTLRSAREVADRLMEDARRRCVELEDKVASSLDHEVTMRVDGLVRTHGRLLSGLSGMRDALDQALDHDAMLGPIQHLSFADLAGETVRVHAPVPDGRSPERPGWGSS